MQRRKRRKAHIQPTQLLPGKTLHRNHGKGWHTRNLHRLVQQNRDDKMKYLLAHRFIYGKNNKQYNPLTVSTVFDFAQQFYW